MNWLRSLPAAPDYFIEHEGHEYEHSEDCKACQPKPDTGLCLPSCRCGGRLRGTECMGVINSEPQDCPKCRRS